MFILRRLVDDHTVEQPIAIGTTVHCERLLRLLQVWNVEHLAIEAEGTAIAIGGKQIEPAAMPDAFHAPRRSGKASELPNSPQLSGNARLGPDGAQFPVLAAAVLPLTIMACFSVIERGLVIAPSIMPISNLTISSPSSTIGWWTDVSAGRLTRA